MAGSSPVCVEAIIPTALFFTADANPASCRVIGWELKSVGPAIVQIYPLYVLIKSEDFFVDGSIITPLGLLA